MGKKIISLNLGTKIFDEAVKKIAGETSDRLADISNVDVLGLVGGISDSNYLQAVIIMMMMNKIHDQVKVFPPNEPSSAVL